MRDPRKSRMHVRGRVWVCGHGGSGRITATVLEDQRKSGCLPKSPAPGSANQVPRITIHCLPSAGMVEFWEIIRTIWKSQVREDRSWREDFLPLLPGKLHLFHLGLRLVLSPPRHAGPGISSLYSAPSGHKGMVTYGTVHFL